MKVVMTPPRMRRGVKPDESRPPGRSLTSRPSRWRTSGKSFRPGDSTAKGSNPNSLEGKNISSLSAVFWGKSKPWQLRPIEIQIVLSVKTNFFKVSIFSTVETKFFFLVEIFKIETFQSRFSCVKIFETFGDLSRYLDIIKAFWGTSGSKILTNWEILIEKCDKIDQLSIETFGTGRWFRDKIEISRLRYPDCLD